MVTVKFDVVVSLNDYILTGPESDLTFFDLKFLTIVLSLHVFVWMHIFGIT